MTVTLPNHVSMATSRPVAGPNGHGWTENIDPPAARHGGTLCKKHGSYVTSMFDVAHNRGVTTAIIATKGKFSILVQSFDDAEGAPDLDGNDNGKGNFESSSGEQIFPGWRALVGGEKFNEALGSREALSALFGVLWWTFAYAALSTFLAFSLGTFAAIVFNDPRMRARRLYRVLLLMPYAFPGFLTALVWSGMLNSEFGFINVVLLQGLEVPWFTDPWAARGAVLMVSLWFGYPYMFLVATGALQSIPTDVVEAARVDGANPWQTFRRVKLPLLLVSLSPLLIATFAFNFNNFNIIFLLTKGGPVDLDSPIAAGATDLLITIVYKIAFVDAARDYGLASAYSIVIFVMISAISVVAFRKTKFLEETFD
jgi:arabinogalactan oligomer/maltooligosaccharide transport system permease protein